MKEVKNIALSKEQGKAFFDKLKEVEANRKAALNRIFGKDETEEEVEVNVN